MGLVIFWIIIAAVFIAAQLRKQKQQEALRRQQGNGQAKRPAPQKNTAPPNVILERAKQNTQEVHSSHVERERESSMRGYGGGPQTAGKGKQTAQTAFGSPEIGTAASGVPANEQERIRKTKERLQKELLSERNDENSRSGRNRIMEAAKEDALETRIDNLSDSSRDFIKEVQELMVKGPDDVLSGQRDFVAEGMAMVNDALIR